VGDKEMENGTVAVRARGKGDMGTMAADEFMSRILVEVSTKSMG
jgi:threonyl-tRNA synthetase